MIILPQWLQYIESQIGFVLPVAQHRWLKRAIRSTAQSYNLSVAELWNRIQDDIELRQKLFDSILILESRFFRHQPSIDYICHLALQQQAIISQHRKNPVHAGGAHDSNNDNNIDNSSDNDYQIWSVGCSEGQEVWSIAMCLAEAGVEHYHILGTDISTKAVKLSRQATYDIRSKEDIPKKYHHFIHQSDKNVSDSKQAVQWTVDKSLQAHVSFALNNIFLSRNLWQSSARLLSKKDVIVCQNMLIYFRQFDQRDILARLVDRCKVGGHIILAPGEGFGWQHPQMLRVANEHINAWQKIK